MELDIIRLGAQVGRLSIRDAGLYRQISARIAPAGTLLRLYLDGEAFGLEHRQDLAQQGVVALCRR